MTKTLLAISLTAILGIPFMAVAKTNDNPKAPENVVISLSDDYKTVTVSWDAVGSVGESGGHVDTANLTYYIFDAFGSFYDPAIATTTSTSYTFDYANIEGQDFVAYQITAGVDETWYSLPVNSAIVVVGQPSELPFVESFANGKQMQVWAINPASEGNVTYGCKRDNQVKIHTSAGAEYLNSQDSDNGFFYIEPKSKGATFGFFSTKIALTDTQHPELKFYCHGEAAELNVAIASDGDEFSIAKEIRLLDTPASEWTEQTLDLSDYKDSKYIQIAFDIASPLGANGEKWNIALDNIRIQEEESGIKSKYADAARIIVTPGGIIVCGEGNMALSIYSMDGKCVHAGMAHSSAFIPLERGIYVVNAGGKAEKVLIK